MITNSEAQDLIEIVADLDTPLTLPEACDVLRDAMDAAEHWEKERKFVCAALQAQLDTLEAPYRAAEKTVDELKEVVKLRIVGMVEAANDLIAQQIKTKQQLTPLEYPKGLTSKRKLVLTIADPDALNPDFLKAVPDYGVIQAAVEQGHDVAGVDVSHEISVSLNRSHYAGVV